MINANIFECGDLQKLGKLSCHAIRLALGYSIAILFLALNSCLAILKPTDIKNELQSG